MGEGRSEMSIVKMPGFTGEASLYTSDEHYRAGGISHGLMDSRGVLPQLPVWTTDTVCKACGCTVSGFVCNCGLRPDPRKLECIQNGGPSRAVPVFGGVGIGGGVFKAS
jgi:hypothetical protein